MLPLHDNVPTRRVPVVTLGLTAANFAVWFFGAATVYLVAERPPLRRHR